MKRIYFLSCLFLGSYSCFSQENTLSISQFLEIVVSNHPIAKQADLYVKDALAEIKIAKGGFDPKVIANFDQKVFNDKVYFNRLDQVVKIPVQFGGIEFKAGYDRNIGETLSDDIRTPNAGTPYAGISIPLVQGFAMDERRNTLKQAQIFQNIADTEKIKTLNKLIFSASKTYFDWQLNYQVLKIQKSFYDLAEQRFVAIKNRFLLEDLAAIDTLEVSILKDERWMQFKNAEIDFLNQGLVLSTYLWDKNGGIFELKNNVIPLLNQFKVIDNQDFKILYDQAVLKHPEILKLNYLNNQLNIEQRFRKEFLKPRLDLTATSLVPLSNKNTENVYSKNIDNYKITLDLIFPIFARKEKGKIEQVKIKQLKNKLELDLFKKVVENDIIIAFSEMQNLEKQINIQKNIILNQQKLLESENAKFMMGESNLFMINSRESKLLEQVIKQEILNFKIQKAKAVLFYTVGKIEVE